MCTKRLLVLLISLVTAQTMFAQQWGTIVTTSGGAKEKPVFLSVYAEGGLSVSSYHATEENYDPGFTALTGFNIGAGVNMRFLKRDERSSVKDGLLGLQTGLLFTTNGFKSGDVTVKGNYLCLPFDIQFYPIPGLYIEAGPEAFINVGNSPDKANIGGMNLNLTDHKANDLKIGIGAGYVLDKFPAGVSIKYLFGTSDFAENLPWRGNLLRISLFYRFGF